MKSPAKLNLGLRITGRREDGYHFIESIFWPISFHDTASFLASSNPQVRCDWALDSPFRKPELFQNEKNLVGRLCQLLSERIGPIPWDIHISKRIPIGSGLGGCSSNCGTVLSFLTKMGFMNSTDAESFAIQLGADIPFFIQPQPAWVSGVGENRATLKLDGGLSEQLFFLVVVFPFATSTPEIFERFRKSAAPFSAASDFDATRPLSFQSLCSYLKTAKNDLEPIVRQSAEPLAKTLDILNLTDCLYASLSGTGSTCFGIYSSPEKRIKAAKDLEQTCRIYSGKTLFAETF